MCTLNSKVIFNLKEKQKWCKRKNDTTLIISVLPSSSTDVFYSAVLRTTVAVMLQAVWQHVCVYKAP